MKTSKILLLATSLLALLLPITALAQVSGSYWTPISGVLNTTVSSYGLKVPGISGGAGCLGRNGAGLITSNGSACGAGSGTVGSGTTGQFPFYNANGTALTATSTIFITQNGQIGIASTSPYGQLSINGVQGATTPLFAVASSTIGNTIQPLRFLIDSNGNTVIGSTTANQKLDIYSGAIRFSYAAPLPAPTVALAGLGAGNIPNGTYVYKLQCGNALGDGFLGATSSPVTVTDNTTNGQVALTLPLCPEPSMTIRRLWRSNNNGASLSWLAFGRGSQGASFNNNTVTSFVDNVATPSDDFGNIPTDAFDSGYIFGSTNKGYSISAQGNSLITGNVATNGGRVTDNNGTLSLGVGLGTNKCGIVVEDNFNQDCGTAYLSAVSSNGSKSVLFANKLSFNVSADPTGNGTGALGQFTLGTAAGNVSALGVNDNVFSRSVVNTGTAYAFDSRNYLQSSTLSNFIGYDSTGQFSNTFATVINQYDFRADDFTFLSQGTTTNRYGVYLNFTKPANATTAYGVYQTSLGVSNYLAGFLGLGTTTPFIPLDVASSSASANTNVGFGQVALTDTNAPTNKKHWLLSSEGGSLYVGTTTDKYATSTPAVITATNSGNVGISTTSPQSKLTVNGDIGTDGLPPVISLCGTSPTTTTGDTDTAGTVTQGTIATGCVITFQTPKTNIPFCTVVSDSGLQFSYTVSTSAITITNIGALSGTTLTYGCYQNNL